MDTKAATQIPKTVAGRMIRRGHTPLRIWRALALLALVLILGLSFTPARADDPSAVTQQPRSAHTLSLLNVELSGETRTSLETVFEHLPLQPGQSIVQSDLVEAVATLREADLFKSVEFHTRPGPERGQLVLVLEVQEHGWDFRWAAGNTNLDGWYLAPIVVAKDNPFGEGGFFDWQWRIGFRTSGTMLRYGRPLNAEGKDYWGVGFSSFNTDRPYFSEGVEYRHKVQTTGLGAVYGHRLNRNSLLETGLKFELVNVADHSEAYLGNEDGSIQEDQTIPFEDLPESIARDVGDAGRMVLELDWQHDTRSSDQRAGTPVSGIWSRVKGRAVLQSARSHPEVQGDLRWYQEAVGGVLATRLRAAWVGESAPFHDRLYLGGMYTVRGFPTNSLSATGGDTWLWSASVEHRSQILGDHKGTKLAGIFFLDAGASGASDADDPYNKIAAAAGYGIRLRVWWLDWIGVDVGFPLTERPVDMRFQANASIGWSF